MLPKLTLSSTVPVSKYEADLDVSSLKGARILVTGGASGLGAGMAEAYAQAGAHVTIVDLNETLATSHAKDLQQKGYSVQAVIADISSWPSLVSAFKSALIFGPGPARLDHVVACAGIDTKPFFPATETQPPSADTAPEEPPTKVLDVNVKGAEFTVRLAQYYMSIPSSDTPRDKSIMLLGSTAAYWSIPLNGLYCASKGAVRSLFKTMRGPMAARGIRLNLLAPWLIRTPLTEHLVQLFGEVGFPVGEPDAVVKAAMLVTADREIVGRSVQVGIGEVCDMRDDAEGMHGGLVSNELMERYLKGPRGLDEMHSKVLSEFGYENITETL